MKVIRYNANDGIWFCTDEEAQLEVEMYNFLSKWYPYETCMLMYSGTDSETEVSCITLSVEDFEGEDPKALFKHGFTSFGIIPDFDSLVRDKMFLIFPWEYDGAGELVFSDSVNDDCILVGNARKDEFVKDALALRKKLY